MKLKTVDLDGKTYAEISDGKPLFIDEDGKEIAIDVANTRATIGRLNAEAKSFREAKEAAEAKLKTFEGIEDGDAARKALETVKNLKDGDLVTAGKVEEIKAAARKAAEEQVAAAAKASAEQIAAVTKERDALQSSLYDEKIGGAFSRSKFIAEKIAVPPDMVQATFGKAFKVEDGRTVAYDHTGNKIYSRAKPGEIADFDEALETLVENYTYRDSILKGSGTGSGAKPNGGAGGGGGKSLTRKEFDALAPMDRTAKMRDGFTVVD